jgi:hypothetical protein
MSVEELLYNILTADTAFTTQSGGIYWRQAPSGASLPYIVYFQVDDPRTKELLAFYGGEARIQFSIFDADASNALTTSAQLIDKVKELRGLQSGLRIRGTVANVLTQPANLDGIYHRTVDVIVHYTEES